MLSPYQNQHIIAPSEGKSARELLEPEFDALIGGFISGETFLLRWEDMNDAYDELTRDDAEDMLSSYLPKLQNAVSGEVREHAFMSLLGVVGAFTLSSTSKMKSVGTSNWIYGPYSSKQEDNPPRDWCWEVLRKMPVELLYSSNLKELYKDNRLSHPFA